MKKAIFLIVTLLTLFFIPTMVKADTWLDDPSYRDTSWFDPSTYNNVKGDVSSFYGNYDYLINTPEKLAGLLYLVNVEGYTFQNEVIKITGNKVIYENKTSNFFIDMSAHDWVPLNSNFGGILYSYYYDNNKGSIDNYFYFKTNENEFRFTDKSTVSCCRNSSCSIVDSMDRNFYTRVKFDTNVTINGNGTTTVSELTNVLNESVYFYAVPDKFNYVDSIVVKDYQGNILYEKYDIHSLENEFVSLSTSRPMGSLYVEVNFGKHDKWQCQVISGSGKEIGDEIACGEEHFYLLSKDSEKVRMISKYNLYTGTTISKIKIEKDSSDNRTDEEYCQDLATSLGAESRREGYYNIPNYCFIAQEISTDLITQNEEAKSAHWDEDGNYLYPQVGDIYIESRQYYNGHINTFVDFYVDEASGDKYDGYFYDLTLGNNNSETSILTKLKSYKTTLNFYGVDVTDVDLLTLDEINEITKLNNKTLPYQEWSSATPTIQPPHYEFGFLNDLLAKKHSFIYNTTYWIRAGYDRSNNGIGVNSVVFVDSSGGICGAGFDTTSRSVCGSILNDYKTKLGCGVRPVITIPISELSYKVDTEIDENGEIEVVDNAKGGEEITFKLTSKNGVKLKEIIVRTSSGEEIAFEENDLIKNEDGTISIMLNKFTMPFENVTIAVNWKIDEVLDNPATDDSIKKYCFILFISFGTLLAINRRCHKIVKNN